MLGLDFVPTNFPGETWEFPLMGNRLDNIRFLAMKTMWLQHVSQSKAKAEDKLRNNILLIHRGNFDLTLINPMTTQNVSDYVGCWICCERESVRRSVVPIGR